MIMEVNRIVLENDKRMYAKVVHVNSCKMHGSEWHCIHRLLRNSVAQLLAHLRWLGSSV